MTAAACPPAFVIMYWVLPCQVTLTGRCQLYVSGADCRSNLETAHKSLQQKRGDL